MYSNVVSDGPGLLCPPALAHSSAEALSQQAPSIAGLSQKNLSIRTQLPAMAGGSQESLRLRSHQGCARGARGREEKVPTFPWAIEGLPSKWGAERCPPSPACLAGESGGSGTMVGRSQASLAAPGTGAAEAALGVASLRSGCREQPCHKNRSWESENKNITHDFRLAESMIDCLIPTHAPFLLTRVTQPWHGHGGFSWLLPSSREQKTYPLVNTGSDNQAQCSRG